MSQVPTTDQLRNNIDSGASGEKVSFPDPAAAPLGTDAEASGNPPTEAERRLEANSQPIVRETRPMNGPALYVAIVAVLVALMVLVWIFA